MLSIMKIQIKKQKWKICSKNNYIAKKLIILSKIIVE